MPLRRPPGQSLEGTTRSRQRVRSDRRPMVRRPRFPAQRWAKVDATLPSMAATQPHVALPIRPGEHIPTADQRVLVYGVSWAHYEAHLAMRGEKSVPRIAYLRGTLELMSPSRDH